MNESQSPIPSDSSITGKLESTLWTNSRRELLEWLARNSPSLGELFEGATMLLFGSQIPGYSGFVSHAVREIRNRLPGVVSGRDSSGRLDYKGRIDQIALGWKKAAISLEQKPAEAEITNSVSALSSSTILLPRKLAQKIGRLIEDHNAAREKPIDAAIRLFEGIAPENERFRDNLRPVVLQWLETCDWFMERTHDSGTIDSAVEIEELRRNFVIFESTLLTIIRGFSSFFTNTDELDECLGWTPTPENVDATVARLGHGEYNRYFFDRLASPAWIRPLKLKGFFSSPPKPTRDDERGTIAFMIWPEARYLFRMAARDPEAVAEVALQVPNTENVRVHDDLVDIALALPAGLAAKFVPDAKLWIRAPYELLLPEKLGALISKLATEGEAQSALDLTRSVLEVLPDSKPILVPEPRGHFDTWHYERVLRRDIPK